MMYPNPNIVPYRFSNLPQVSRSEIQFFDTLARLVPANVFSPEFQTATMELLQRYTHATVSWNWTGQDRLVTAEELQQIILSPTLLVQLAVLPTSQDIFLEIDPKMAGILIDKALGGTGEGIDEFRSLTEVERGVFQFLFLKVLQLIQSEWGDAARLDFRLRQLSDHLDPSLLEPSQSFYRKEMRLSSVGKSGFLRIHLPLELIHQVESSLPPLTSTPQELFFFRQRLHRIEDTPLVGMIQVATARLSEADMAGLEGGDIIVLEECLARPEEEGWLSGEARLVFGLQCKAGLLCSVQMSPTEVNVQLEQVIQIEEPAMNGASDGSEYMNEQPSEHSSEYEGGPNDNLQEMGPVMSDVPVPLVVELGRIECRAREVMYFRLGQVMELRRSPHQPLDLVLNGQILGKGELVEIEGQLGVRIVELNK